MKRKGRYVDEFKCHNSLLLKLSKDKAAANDDGVVSVTTFPFKCYKYGCYINVLADYGIWICAGSVASVSIYIYNSPCHKNFRQGPDDFRKHQHDSKCPFGDWHVYTISILGHSKYFMSYIKTENLVWNARLKCISWLITSLVPVKSGGDLKNAILNLDLLTVQIFLW